MKKFIGLFLFLFISLTIILSSPVSATSTPTPQPTPIPQKQPNDDKTVIIKSPAQKIAQLVGDYDNHLLTPTINLTNENYNLSRTDLGIPFTHKGRTYLLFGDAWNPPDDPIAYTTDTTPEDGLELTFLQNENAAYRPIQIPGISLGAFEVPSEGVSIDQNIYIYVTTDHTPQTVMGRSVVAVSSDDGQTFTYLYDFSTDKFINLSAVKTDQLPSDPYPQPSQQALLLFGSGTYRQSNIHLAYQPASQIEDPTSLYYFSGLDQNQNPTWSTSEQQAQPLFDQPCIGEFSVSYNQFIQKWIMLYNCEFENSRGINLRTASNPWGPWSSPVILFHPWDDNGYCHFIHVNWEFRNCDQVHDPGRENEWGGEYGPYQFEDLAIGTSTQTTIYFTMSTWNPYTVVLMKATLALK